MQRTASVEKLQELENLEELEDGSQKKTVDFASVMHVMMHEHDTS